MTARFFDSHAHYDDRRFDGDRDEVLAALPGSGVSGVLNAASDLASAKLSVELAEKYGFVYASAGIHPHEARDAPPDFIAGLRELLRHPKCLAVGECGLDYHYDFSPREKQLRVFEMQLELAIELNMPVIVHDREAHADTLRLLKKHRPRGVVHCYSGSAQMAKELLSLGLYIGFTGVITFAGARKTAEAAKAVPLGRLLIETDCPYMAPVPFRGKRCDSSMLPRTAAALAEIKEVSVEELAGISDKNARQLYIRGTPLLPGTVTQTLICVDTIVNGDFSGRFYNLYMKRPHRFMSIFHYVSLMEKFFDYMRFPQNSLAQRHFSREYRYQSAYRKPLVEVKQYMSEATFESEHGDRATFLVQVQFRQNATWQGTITWTEQKKTNHFRSTLEMVKLMDSALNDAQNMGDGGALSETWE